MTGIPGRDPIFVFEVYQNGDGSHCQRRSNKENKNKRPHLDTAFLAASNSNADISLPNRHGSLPVLIDMAMYPAIEPPDTPSFLYNACDNPKNTPRRAPNCGAPTPMPVPLRM
jgi:hypothetical protein